ncbi:hypothetical protein B2J93_3892 [Marssonina coronariae]|uniref:Uncharacterized protein n=1 Tax=Diplocarpon coronariae TaxID=2795749 RepID=A0A218YWE0_9HELO|nr:hypothetical protein B2J93_3892 [Marssonina coronariae]
MEAGTSFGHDGYAGISVEDLPRKYQRLSLEVHSHRDRGPKSGAGMEARRHLLGSTKPLDWVLFQPERGPPSCYRAVAGKQICRLWRLVRVRVPGDQSRRWWGPGRAPRPLPTYILWWHLERKGLGSKRMKRPSKLDLKLELRPWHVLAETEAMRRVLHDTVERVVGWNIRSRRRKLLQIWKRCERHTQEATTRISKKRRRRGREERGTGGRTPAVEAGGTGAAADGAAASFQRRLRAKIPSKDLSERDVSVTVVRPEPDDVAGETEEIVNNTGSPACRIHTAGVSPCTRRLRLGSCEQRSRMEMAHKTRAPASGRQRGVIAVHARSDGVPGLHLCAVRRELRRRCASPSGVPTALDVSDSSHDDYGDGVRDDRTGD